ncbi:hypothetical protein [Curtobacterium sp. MCSS17_016]|uniref:hypothetical protein n=1 Tax=Curtobacterium sp. MCSS17_016 TaxID=2175644 RepID=UPI0015E8B4A9|nr:hypothetical protein [Curtobacterium sp. MCSS17_016]WIE81054.1 hypothetical protein DEJ19_021290 [Curtobacterium sp. MCSS17_016]
MSLLVVVAVALVMLFVVRAYQDHRPYVASADEAAKQDMRTVTALNAFIEANGGLPRWRDYDEPQGTSLTAPYRTLHHTSVCDNTGLLGFSSSVAGQRNDVTLLSTSKITPRAVLDNAERAWSKYDVKRGGDNRGLNTWTQVSFSGGRTGPTFYVNYYGDDPDAKVNIIILAASVCKAL